MPSQGDLLQPEHAPGAKDWVQEGRGEGLGAETVNHSVQEGRCIPAPTPFCATLHVYFLKVQLHIQDRILHRELL